MSTKRFSPANLIELREQAGLTQEQLTERISLKTRGALGHYERGRRTPSADILGQLAAVLDCKVDDFFSIAA